MPMQREAARAGYRIFRSRDGFEVALGVAVIRRAILMGRSAAPNEWIGLLVGQLFSDDGGDHVVVVGLVPDVDAVVGPGFVATSHESEFRTRALARTLFPDGIIVGWVHGHVRHGVQYSATDRQNQATWRKEHAIGIVVDPWDPKELAVYRGPESELLQEVLPREEDTAPAAFAKAAKPVSESTRNPASLALNVCVFLCAFATLACAILVGVALQRVRVIEGQLDGARAREARTAATLEQVSAELTVFAESLAVEAPDSDGDHTDADFQER